MVHEVANPKRNHRIWLRRKAVAQGRIHPKEIDKLRQYVEPHLSYAVINYSEIRSTVQGISVLFVLSVFVCSCRAMTRVCFAEGLRRFHINQITKRRMENTLGLVCRTVGNLIQWCKFHVHQGKENDFYLLIGF